MQLMIVQKALNYFQVVILTFLKKRFNLQIVITKLAIMFHLMDEILTNNSFKICK